MVARERRWRQHWRGFGRSRASPDLGRGFESAPDAGYTEAVSPAPTTVIFILSSAHSGSTWVGYVLGSTAQSAFLGEYFRPWDSQARVPCTICAMRGLASCTILHGAETLPDSDAFSFAAARTGAGVLVDNSKQIGWAEKFVGRPGLDCRFVHVVRDPRGWVASTKRRGQGDLEGARAVWLAENAGFREAAKRNGVRAMTVCYDLLALRPAATWPLLFGFCGLRFDPNALRYWETAHHGFAANGASDALVKAAGGVPPGHFATGDDGFYARRSRQDFHDDRWRDSLTRQEQDAIGNDPEVRGLLAAMGYRLTRNDIRAAKEGVLF